MCCVLLRVGEQLSGGNPRTQSGESRVGADLDSTEVLSQASKRFASGLGRNVTVDIHGYRDLTVPKDLHRDTWVYIEGDQQRGAGLSGRVHGDGGNLRSCGALP